MLPGAVAAVPTKSIYENVVTEEMAETLAKYMDGILKSTKKLDLQPKDWLHKVIVGVFVPLSSKDVFEAFYKKDLAKRLLWNRVVSMDVEKQVCSMLKAECGSGYSSKIEGMFQDIENSRETMLVYQQQHQQPPSGSSGTTTDAAAVTFEVQVLTTGYWPLYPEYPNLILPRFLQDHQEHFVEFYKSKYQGRRVAWKYALGHCVIKTRGFAKPYELVLSLTQAIVLIQFGDSSSVAGNTNNTRTLPELMKLTGLEDREEMERILQSLSLGKDGTRILRKMDHPGEGSSSSSAASAAAAAASKPKRVVSDQDTFCINESFSNKALRIRITNIMTKETKQERDTTVAAVSRDRLYLIDAAIVRILKSRKSLLHQALVPQVLEHLKFPAKIPDIKLRIESLIEREYVERDGQDRNRYNYLA
jgi:cullin 4